MVQNSIYLALPVALAVTPAEQHADAGPAQSDDTRIVLDPDHREQTDRHREQ